jgi:hypothetical protein
VQDVIYSIPHFAKALLRNMPYRYVSVEKRSVDMKFRNTKKFRYGVPAYTGSYRALVLNEIFEDRQIGRRLCSSRSPDLNPCDFYLLRNMKDNV